MSLRKSSSRCYWIRTIDLYPVNANTTLLYPYTTKTPYFLSIIYRGFKWKKTMLMARMFFFAVELFYIENEIDCETD